MNIAKAMEVMYINDKSAYITCGIHHMYMCYSDSDGTIFVGYVVGGCKFAHQWPCTGEGIEESLWEWLCTLSRFTNPDKIRILGSYSRVRRA